MKRRDILAICLYGNLLCVQGFCVERYLNEYNTPNLLCKRKQKMPSTIHYSSAFFEDNEINWGDDDDEDDDDDVLLSSSSVEISSRNMEDIDDMDDSYYEQLFKQVELKVNDEHIDEEVIIEEEEQVEQESYNYKLDVAYRKRFQKESVERRKQTSKRTRRKRLEDRAALLALRALRESMKFETAYASMSRDGTRVHEESPVYFYPVPTLSQSASVNFRRAGESDMDILALEKKLYGQRFRKALNIYTRLLQRIEDMQVEAKQKASEIIMDEMAHRAAHQSLNFTKDEGTHASKVASESSLCHFRMRWIAHLSLYEGTRKMSGPLPNSVWKKLPTADLVSILYIRGNVGGRGRLPRSREKVVKRLEESLFQYPLF